MGYSYGFKLFGGGGAGGSGVGTSLTTQVLFNSSGSVAGDDGLTYDAVTDSVTTGRILVGNGSATAPSVARAASGATGWFFAPYSVYFSDDGTPVFSLTHNNALTISSGLAFVFGNAATGSGDSGLRRVSPGLVGVTSGGSNLGSLQAGNVTAVALGTPAEPTHVIVGTAGTKTTDYTVVAILNDGTHSSFAPVHIINNAPDVQDGTNFIRLSVAPVTNAAGYVWYRYFTDATPVTQGKIATTTLPTLDDTGLAGDGSAYPTTNTTGRVLVGDGSAGITGGSGFVELLDSAGSRDVQMRVGDSAGLLSATGRWAVGESQLGELAVTSYGPLHLWTKGPYAGAQTVTLGRGALLAPQPYTLTIGESGLGTDIPGANGVIQSGAGTGSGAGSTLEFKTPAVGGSGTGAQTMTTRLQLGSSVINIGDGNLLRVDQANTVVDMGAMVRPQSNDARDMGDPGNVILWRTVGVSRATLGSKTKAIVDATPTAFATFTIADGATYGGEIIYSVVSTQGTAKQRLDGRARFSATREGSTYTVTVNEVGTQTLAAAAGTLTGAIEISGTAGVVTLSGNFNTSQTPDTFVINPRFDSPDAGLALTFP